MESAMRVAILAASLTLSACTAHSQTASSLDSSLDALVGQPVEVAVAQLGQPIGTSRLGTDVVYGFGRMYTATEFSNAVAGPVAPADYRGGVFPQPRQTVQKSCVIRVIVGANGVVRDWNYQSKEQDCRAASARPSA
jgi:hypothetical protein